MLMWMIGEAGFGEVGLFERWVLDGGVLTGAMVLGVGLGLGYILAARGEGKKGAIGALAGVVLGVAIGAASFVETDRELIERQSEALAGAFYEKDVSALEALLSDRLAVAWGGRDLGWADKAGVIGAVEQESGEIARDWGAGVKVRGMDGAKTGRVRLRVRSTGGKYGAGFVVVDLTWNEEREGEWRVVRADLVKRNGEDVTGEPPRGM